MTVMDPVYRDIVEASREIVLLKKQVAELKKSKAWGIHHFTKEELAIHNLNQQMDALSRARSLALNVGYGHKVAIAIRIESIEKQLKELDG